MKDYDLLIIGGGPAGLSAAIYGARYKLKVIVFSKNIGGLAATAHKICNYPSYTEIKGFELMQRFTEQANNLEVEIKYEEIKSIEKIKDYFVIKSEGEKYKGKKVIMALGCERNRLNVPGEGKFLGKGVSYCSTCDAAFFKNKIVSVIGGSDAALTSALLLSEYADKVYVIYRQEKFFRGEPMWVDILMSNKKIQTVFKEEVSEIKGEKNVEEVLLKSGKKIKVSGVFIEIGSTPNSKIAKSIGVKLDNKDFIIVDNKQKTNIEGIFAAGDITNNYLKQIVTASADGAKAAFIAYTEIKKADLI